MNENSTKIHVLYSCPDLSEVPVPNSQLLELSISNSEWKELNLSCTHTHPLSTRFPISFAFYADTYSRNQILTLPFLQPYPSISSWFLHLGKGRLINFIRALLLVSLQFWESQLLSFLFKLILVNYGAWTKYDIMFKSMLSIMRLSAYFFSSFEDVFIDFFRERGRERERHTQKNRNIDVRQKH